MAKVLIAIKDLREGNGIASSIMNYYDSVIEAGYKVDFLLLQDIKSDAQNYVKNRNSDVFILPPKSKKNVVKIYSCMRTVMAHGNYDIVHVNVPGPYGTMFLCVAKWCGIKKRIYHSHNPKNNLTWKSRLISSICNPMCVHMSNTHLACSDNAGKSIFGKREYTVVKNLIDVNKFVYSEKGRTNIRGDLRINASTFVVGVVGRIEEQKNPSFVIACFKEISALRQNSVLVWVGDGSMKAKTQQCVKEIGLSDRVYLVGNKSNLKDWYSAMDCLFLPSKFEGLGIVFIEAQANGLPCYGSLQVPIDTEVTKNMNRLDLELGAKEWAKRITKAQVDDSRIMYVNTVIQAGYDISCNTALVDVYNAN